ncbi:MAG: hypothetical protein EXS42_00650 [Lacunisphaera sp.]|nr:hypothetical protein [Lacunisphaera sp.]
MRKPLSLFSILCALSSVSATATELTDLGQGLSYLRVHSLGDSEKALRFAVPGAGALVLDLRHATTSDDDVEALKVALSGQHPVVHFGQPCDTLSDRNGDRPDVRTDIGRTGLGARAQRRGADCRRSRPTRL